MIVSWISWNSKYKKKREKKRDFESKGELSWRPKKAVNVLIQINLRRNREKNI